jgi:hypothetical protein
MALDEDRPLRSVIVPRGHYRSGGKRARAYRDDVRGLAEIRKLSKQNAQLIEIKRKPVRLD